MAGNGACNHPLEIRSDVTVHPPTDHLSIAQPIRRVRMVCRDCGAMVVLHIGPARAGNDVVELLAGGVEHGE